MSSARLKRRAAEDDSLQNNNLNESFVQYGTPLPSLASTKKDQGEYVPIWQQVSIFKLLASLMSPLYVS
jgi:G patch domain-containing protein 1